MVMSSVCVLVVSTELLPVPKTGATRTPSWFVSISMAAFWLFEAPTLANVICAQTSPGVEERMVAAKLVWLIKVVPPNFKRRVIASVVAMVLFKNVPNRTIRKARLVPRRLAGTENEEIEASVVVLLMGMELEVGGIRP